MTNCRIDSYQGYDIAYNRKTARLDISLNGDELVSRDNWDAAVTYIEGQLNPPKKKKKFVQVEAILLSEYRGTKKGKITGLAENSSFASCQDVWFASDKGERSKEIASSIAPLTPETRRKVEEMEQLKVTIIAANQRISVIKASIPRYTPLEEDVAAK